MLGLDRGCDLAEVSFGFRSIGFGLGFEFVLGLRLHVLSLDLIGVGFGITLD